MEARKKSPCGKQDAGADALRQLVRLLARQAAAEHVEAGLRDERCRR